MGIDKQSKKKGGKRRGAGRPKGAKSQKTIEMEQAAKRYAGGALRTLNEISLHGKSEAARVTAAIAILDRAGGRPRQAVDVGGAGGGPVVVNVVYSHE